MRRALVMIAIALALAPSALAAPSYTIVAVGTFGASVPSYAYDVNSSNQVVGEYGFASQQRPFRYSGGVNTDLGTLGGSTGSANGINDAGVIVGHSSLATCCNRHAFVYSGGTMTDLGTLSGWSSSTGVAINAGGQVAGNLSTPNLTPNTFRGFLWNGSSMTQLPSLGGWTWTADVDSSGTVVGGSRSLPNDRDHAYAYAGGVMTDLGVLPSHDESHALGINDASLVVGYSKSFQLGTTAVKWANGSIVNLGWLPGGYGSFASDVNNAGVVVGTSTDSTERGRAVRWNGTTIVDLNTEIPTGSGWELEAATAINDSGAIVGNGTYNGVPRGFLLVPVPDTTPPAVSCASADGLWHATNVSISCTASDSGSGLANPADASFSLSTSVASGTEDANAATGVRSVCDQAGNCATAGPIAGNRIDRKAPSITIGVPASTTYGFNSVELASYACNDGGSGVASCSGTVANGSAIDTTSVGVNTFDVTATDAAGNTAAAAVQYEVVATPWAQFHGGADRTGVQPNENILDPSTVGGLKLAWSAPTWNPIWSSPAVVDGAVYVASTDGSLYAFSAANGNQLWATQIGNYVSSSPAVVKGQVFIGSDDGNVYALDAGTGKVLWTFTTGGPVYASPAVEHGVVYVGSWDANLYALDAATGRLLWSQNVHYPVRDSAAVEGGVVYVGTDELFAFDASGGSLLWSTPFPSGVQSTPAVSGKLILVGAPDGLYALELSGSVAWYAPTKDQVTDSPVTDGSLAYVGTMDGRLHAFDLGTGANVWSTYLGAGWVTSSPAYANGVVYIGVSDGWSPNHAVDALDAATGTVLWSYAVPALVISSPAVADGTVYIGADDGQLYAFRP